MATCSLPEWITESGGSVVDECVFGGTCNLIFELIQHPDRWDNSTDNSTGTPEYFADFYPAVNETIGNITCVCPSDRLGVNCEICECSK